LQEQRDEGMKVRTGKEGDPLGRPCISKVMISLP
jgi:hypothetical protein